MKKIFVIVAGLIILGGIAFAYSQTRLFKGMFSTTVEIGTGGSSLTETVTDTSESDTTGDVSIKLPDLYVERLLSVGDDGALRAEVCLNGVTDVSSVELSYTLTDTDGNTLKGESVVSEVFTDGGCVFEDILNLSDTTLKYGRVTALVSVDHTNLLEEENESNNTLDTFVQYRRTIGGTTSDAVGTFTCENLDLTPDNVELEEGETAEFNMNLDLDIQYSTETASKRGILSWVPGWMLQAFTLGSGTVDVEDSLVPPTVEETFKLELSTDGEGSFLTSRREAGRILNYVLTAVYNTATEEMSLQMEDGSEFKSTGIKFRGGAAGETITARLVDTSCMDQIAITQVEDLSFEAGTSGEDERSTSAVGTESSDTSSETSGEIQSLGDLLGTSTESSTDTSTDTAVGLDGDLLTGTSTSESSTDTAVGLDGDLSTETSTSESSVNLDNDILGISNDDTSDTDTTSSELLGDTSVTTDDMDAMPNSSTEENKTEDDEEALDKEVLDEATQEIVQNAQTAAQGCVYDRHPFIDSIGHWAEKLICEKYMDGHIVGRDATHFAPDASITQMEYIAVLARQMGYSVNYGNGLNYSMDYMDEGHWGYGWAKIALHLGWIEADFSPDIKATRGMMAVVAARAYNQTHYYTQNELTQLGAKDLPVNAATTYAMYIWATTEVPDVRDGSMISVINGNGNGLYRPNDYASRAEAMTILQRLDLAAEYALFQY